MNLNHWHRVACLALLLPVMAASGCTGSDVLTPTTGNVRIEVAVDNVPGDFRFDTARFRIRQIIVRPTDPAADAVLGDEPIGVLQSGVTLNFDITEPNVTVLPLADGTYRLQEIIINSIKIEDDDRHPCNYAPFPPPCEDARCACEDVSCDDYISLYRSGDSGAVSISNFGRDILIHVEGGVETVVRVVIDWGVFLEALQASWPCTEICVDPPYDPDDVFCPGDPFGSVFMEGTFNQFAPDFLTVN
jgi:hypothetical protein